MVAQDVYRWGALPVVNVNTKLGGGFSFNTKLESRHIFGRGGFNGENSNTDYRFERQDIELLLAIKLSANIRVAGGYMLRIESDRLVHRISQQVSLTQITPAARLAHRFKADQTWDREEEFELRLRYRAGAEFAISGTRVDPDEFYLKANLEYLVRFQGGFSSEIRALPALGYLAPNKNAFEFGLDYRHGNVLESTGAHGFWIYLGWFLRFD